MEGNMFWNMDEVNWISWPSPENPFIIKRGACKNCFSYVTCLFSADFTSLAITYWETLKKKEIEIQSNLAIRNFSVALKFFPNAKSSLSLWSKWQIGHRKWFLNTNLFLIKPFLIAKFDCTRLMMTFNPIFRYLQFSKIIQYWCKLFAEKTWNSTATFWNQKSNPKTGERNIKTYGKFKIFDEIIILKYNLCTHSRTRTRIQ